jgi:3-oxoadipate enol-lactonase
VNAPGLPYHEVTGDGPAVVLVHAGICDSRMWEPQWASLAAAHRLVRIDLRGFGRSPLPPEPFAHARDVLAVMDAAGVERAALVGASMGGRVVLEAALAAPERVTALVLAGAGMPGHEWAQDVRDYWAAEEAAFERGDLEAAADLNVEFWVGPANAEVRGQVRAMQLRAFELQAGVAEDPEEALVPDVADRVGELAQPALVVAGELDHPDILAIAGGLERTLANATAARIPGAAHLPSLERPAAFDAVVAPFLERASAAT